MKTNKKGNLAEIKAAHRFIESGNNVSIPFGNGGKYDLIRDDGELHRVQVKHGRINDGRVVSELHTRYQKEGEWDSTIQTKETIDEFAIYCPETDEVYRIGVEEAPDWKVGFRIEDIDRKDSRVRWAEDYKI
jgi:hypothetical protein